MRLIAAPMKDRYRVLVMSGGTVKEKGILELRDTNNGARPHRFRYQRDNDVEPQNPRDIIDLARKSTETIYASPGGEHRINGFTEMMEDHGVEVIQRDVCRVCLTSNEYTELTPDNSCVSGDEVICMDCAMNQIRRASGGVGGLSSDTLTGLRDVLDRVGEVGRVMQLLKSTTDPDATRFDEVEATTEHIDTVAVDTLDIPEDLRGLIGHDELLPVQSKAVHSGLLDGDDLLVVSATATGKTLVGEIAALNNLDKGSGKAVFVVPLVALANQKYHDFKDAYGDVADVTLRTGTHRIHGSDIEFNPDADIIVGTYEGIDQLIRTGHSIDASTVIVDEVHNLMDEDRGHRLDGLIARLRHQASDAQWIYLSATVGDSVGLASDLDAGLVEYEERPVPIERHLTFADSTNKIDVVRELVKREYRHKSSKGYRGQSIIFTNSRKRCEYLSEQLGGDIISYHAGLPGNQRKTREKQFIEGDAPAVVTTAALGAGVDFPASQVVFERLAMGIEWLGIGEFEQMAGRAGRPDYHDRGIVYLIAEPDRVYHGGMKRTEDEVAINLLNGELPSESIDYKGEQAAEEILADIAAYREDWRGAASHHSAEFNQEYALKTLRDAELIRGEEITGLGVIAARYFLSPTEMKDITSGIRRGDKATEINAELELDRDK